MIRRAVRRNAVCSAVCLIAASLLVVGCGPDRFIVLTNPVNASSTGNWQITATTTSGTQPFTALSGSILEGTATPNSPTPLFWVLQAVTPDSCFVGAATVPLEGALTGSSFSLVSLSDSGQYLNVNGTKASDGSTLSGTFLINDGCANGVAGNLSGIKIAPFAGSYSGPWTVGSGGNTLSLSVSQDSFADGYGFFHLQGSVSFTGLNCFTSGTLQSSASTISGQQVQLNVATNENTSSAPSTVMLLGTLDPAAHVLTLTSIQVVSGGCSGAAGTATLTLS